MLFLNIGDVGDNIGTQNHPLYCLFQKSRIIRGFFCIVPPERFQVIVQMIAVPGLFTRIVEKPDIVRQSGGMQTVLGKGSSRRQIILQRIQQQKIFPANGCTEDVVDIKAVCQSMPENGRIVRGIMQKREI